MKTLALLVVTASILLNVSCSTNSSAPNGDYTMSPNPIQSKTGVVVRPR
ncbi:MAG: hypothetical protein U0984_14330 [Prosthecobacter sp.]|nr:hypothetical protein [Prosthecobacter sp.]